MNSKKRIRYGFIIVAIGVVIVLLLLLQNNKSEKISKLHSGTSLTLNEHDNTTTLSTSPASNNIVQQKQAVEDQQLSELQLGKRPADFIDMTWDSWQFDVGFEDRTLLAEKINGIPIEKKASITEEQLNRLRTGVCEILFDFGNNNFDAYYKYLRDSGEILPVQMHEALRKNLIDEKEISEEKIAAEPWEFLSQVSREYKDNSSWKGVVTRHSKIEVFETETHQLKEPAYQLQGIRGGIATWNHITEPPVSFPDAIKQNGKVMVADFTVFIAHTDDVGGKVRPYGIRFWYDSTHEIWRPLRMTFFPNPFESLNPMMPF